MKRKELAIKFTPRKPLRVITEVGIDLLGLDLQLIASIGSALLKLSFSRKSFIIT